MANKRRTAIVNDIKNVLTLLGDCAKVHLYRGFEGSTGDIYIEFETDIRGNKTRGLNIIGLFGCDDEDYISISKMRTRNLMALRYALFAEYGKKRYYKILFAEYLKKIHNKK